MGVKMINQLHKYISEEKPDEGALRKFVKEMAYNNSPTERTITVRYSQIKKHIRETHPEYSDQFLKELNPPAALTKKIIEENKERKLKKKQISFNDELIEKIYSFKDSENPYERSIYLQFISGRRINEIFDNDFKISNANPTQVSMKLSKKNGDEKSKFHKFSLIKDTSTNKEFRDSLKKLRSSVNGMSVKDFTNRINRKIRDKVRKDLSSHDLRAMYGVYRFNTDNPEEQNLVGYINNVLNHGDQSIDSSVSYSNFTYQ